MKTPSSFHRAAVIAGLVLMAVPATLRPALAGEQIQAPRGQDTERPRCQDTERPRGQDTERPRGQDTERPRGAEARERSGFAE